MWYYLTKLFRGLFGRRRLIGDRAPLLDLDIAMRPCSEIDQKRQADFGRRLASMPLFVRETYLLRTVDNMSIDEISSRLAISPRSTRRHLRRAILILTANPDE